MIRKPTRETIDGAEAANSEDRKKPKIDGASASEAAHLTVFSAENRIEPAPDSSLSLKL